MAEHWPPESVISHPTTSCITRSVPQRGDVRSDPPVLGALSRGKHVVLLIMYIGDMPQSHTAT